MYKKLLFLLLIPAIGTSQTQIGQRLEGDANDDRFGSSVALSANGTILAIGAPLNDGNGTNSGHVQVYENISGVWTQIGNDIQGEGTSDRCGESVAISSNGNIVAIGAPSNKNGTGISSGHVRVFENISGVWTQIGGDIDGQVSQDRAGSCVALSADGTVVAIGADGNSANGMNSGRVRVFRNIAGTWAQEGQSIDGIAANDRTGYRVSLSSDGSILAVASPWNDSQGLDSGLVRIYQNVAGTWTQMGQDLSETGTNLTGCGLALSSDGSIVAVGFPYDDNINGNKTGKVKIYKYSSSSWTQVGQDINGITVDEYSGENLALSSDGSVVAVSAILNNANGSSTGRVRVYRNVGGSWVQAGSPLDGEAGGNFFGIGISLSSDGSTLAAGAIETQAGINSSTRGYAKTYDLSALLSSDSFVKANFDVYPNPATEVINITLENELLLEDVVIYNNLGQIVKTAKDTTVNVSSLAKGLYHVEVITNKGKAYKKVILK